MRATIPAPVGGLNTRDAYDSMPITDCIEFRNLYCKGNYVETRDGYSVEKDLIYPESIIEYFGSEPKILYTHNNSIYEMGYDLPLIDTINTTQVTNFYFKQRTFIMNRGFLPKVYNGSIIEDWAFTGVDENDKIINGFASKNRCFFIFYNDNGDTGFYYGQPGFIGGDLGKFTFNFKQGGQCIIGGNWSQDNGQSLEDLTYFISENGDVEIYSGSNFPPDITDDIFRLIERYSISKPVGLKCCVNINSDVVVLTQNGIESLSKNLNQSAGQTVLLSDKINNKIVSKKNYFYHWGWELKHHKTMGALWLSCAGDEIFVLNLTDKTPTGELAWSNFDLPIISMGILKDDLYFGTLNSLCKYAGKNDDNGSFIKVSYLQASSDFGYNDIKQLMSLKPMFQSSSDIEYSIKVLVDFRNQNIYGTGENFTTGGTPWDSAPWNTFSWYIEDLVSHFPKILKVNMGVRFSIGLKLKTREKIKILSMDILFKRGSGWKV